MRLVLLAVWWLLGSRRSGPMCSVGVGCGISGGKLDPMPIG